MQIGEVSKRTCLTVDAIRFYEKRKLLPKRLAAQVGSVCTETVRSSASTSSSTCKDRAFHSVRSLN
jgi:hypothetical protein